ncbi:hypothetical protein TSUD_37210 [Trifolium subterraneum]|uniref:NB-ARC domain-containing protein n=1 Tax=Trifolium subterraneum TaxID=3900 RepID=A0A2Z6LIG7_TRISU|nr:hypothetical protein TSUD_37210 [Trifolium subterraneum]
MATQTEMATLCLLAEAYAGQTMVCESQSFPQLHVLKFWVLEKLEEWKIDQGALPCLKQLEIRSCPRLKRLPGGLEHVKTLLELKLKNMPTEINAEMHNFPLPTNCQVVQTNSQWNFISAWKVIWNGEYRVALFFVC